MKAIVIYEPGGPEKLLFQEVPTPKVKPGWSLVQVKGFGINHSEIFTRKGLSPSVTFPRILGIECVGVIAGTTDPKRLPVGQKVISIMGEMGRAFDGGSFHGFSSCCFRCGLVTRVPSAVLDSFTAFRPVKNCKTGLAFFCEMEYNNSIDKRFVLGRMARGVALILFEPKHRKGAILHCHNVSAFPNSCFRTSNIPLRKKLLTDSSQVWYNSIRNGTG